MDSRAKSRKILILLHFERFLMAGQPNKKHHPVRDAFLEWFMGLVLGALPLLGHAAMSNVLPPNTGDKGNWSIDILFVGISASGTSVLSAIMRLVKKVLAIDSVGVGIACMLIFNVVLVVVEAAIYGAVASGQSRPSTVDFALILLASSAFCSMLVELVLANRAAAGDKSASL